MNDMNELLLHFRFQDLGLIFKDLNTAVEMVKFYVHGCHGNTLRFYLTLNPPERKILDEYLINLNKNRLQRIDNSVNLKKTIK